MGISVKDLLADKGVCPSEDHLVKIEAKWAEIQQMKQGIKSMSLNDADIALRNVPGGDHVG